MYLLHLGKDHPSGGGVWSLAWAITSGKGSAIRILGNSVNTTRAWYIPLFNVHQFNSQNLSIIKVHSSIVSCHFLFCFLPSGPSLRSSALSVDGAPPTRLPFSAGLIASVESSCGLRRARFPSVAEFLRPTTPTHPTHPQHTHTHTPTHPHTQTSTHPHTHTPTTLAMSSCFLLSCCGGCWRLKRDEHVQLSQQRSLCLSSSSRASNPGNGRSPSARIGGQYKGPVGEKQPSSQTGNASKMFIWP